MRILVFVVLISMTACAAPKGDKLFDFRTGWTKFGGEIKGHKHTELCDEKNGLHYDENGNLIVSEEIKQTYSFPDVTVGMSYVSAYQRISPIAGVEMCEFKIPIVKWNSVQVVMGDNFIGIYAGKKLTSIVEITIGAGVVRMYNVDGKEDDNALMIGGTITRF